MTETPGWWCKPRDVVVVVDTPGWFDRHAEILVDRINLSGDKASLWRDYPMLEKPDIVFYLSCMKITPPAALARARVNLVAHASDLPNGRGFSPVVWQVLEGASSIPIRLIHADEAVDSGDIVLSDSVDFGGHELNDEIRSRLGEHIVGLCLTYLSADRPLSGRPQQGDSTWYRRRTPADSRLDPNRSIADQFDLLRVVDNLRYPAFFELRGHRYILRIEKDCPAGTESATHDDEG
jgi:methionyl-tRNA formyltransferase